MWLSLSPRIFLMQWELSVLTGRAQTVIHGLLTVTYGHHPFTDQENNVPPSKGRPMVEPSWALGSTSRRATSIS